MTISATFTLGQALALTLLFLCLCSDLASSATILPPFKQPPTTTKQRPNNGVLYPSSSTASPKAIFLWNKEEYPNPMTAHKFCNRTAPSLLCDPDSILTKDQANKLEHLMNQTTNTTKCFCKMCPDGGHGVQVAIALAQNIFRNYNAPVESNSQEFANHLRHRWQYGTCDNTVLILLVAAKDEITISLGAISEKLFEEKFFSSLVMAHQNEFEQGRFYEGLVAIIGGIRHHTISSQRAPTDLGHGGSRTIVPSEDHNQTGTRTAVAVVGIIVGFMLVIFILTGTIILAKNRYEAQAVETATDSSQKPAGYWSKDGQQGVGDEDGNDEDGPEEPSSGRGHQDPDDPDIIDDGAIPPPLPMTPPPSTPSMGSNTTRKLSTPNGVVEYEPVSIEEDDVPRNQPEFQAESQTSQQSAATIPEPKHAESVEHLHGQDEILDQSSRISTPEQVRSRL